MLLFFRYKFIFSLLKIIQKINFSVQIYENDGKNDRKLFRD